MSLSNIGSTLTLQSPTAIAYPTAPTTLTSTNTKPTTSLTSALPTPPVDNTNYSGMIANGNAVTTTNNGSSLGNVTTPSGAVVNATTGAIVTPAPVQDNSNQSTQDYINSLMGTMPKPPSGSDTYNKDYAASGIDTKQTQFNTDNAALKSAQDELAGFNATLAGINAEATAIPIQDQKDAEGRGITAAGLAPKTSDELRNNALKAIPVQVQVLGAQAKVAAAQGNAQLSQSILQQAQDHLDKVFQIQMSDANNQYQYQTDIINKAYAFADKQQQIKLDAQKQALATNQANLTDARNFAQQLSAAATTNGQAGIAAKLASIPAPDINNKTFAADLQNYNNQIAALQKQIIPKSTSSNETWSNPYNLGTKSVQRNNVTGEIRTIGDATQTNNTPYTSAYSSPTDYVNKILSTQGVSYASAEANTPKGYVFAIDNTTGQTGFMNAADWKSKGSGYTPIYNNL